MQQGRDKPEEGQLHRKDPGMVAFENPQSPQMERMLKLRNGFWAKNKSRALSRKRGLKVKLRVELKNPLL